MKKWWYTLSLWGIHPNMPEQQYRAVLLSNRLSALIFVLNTLAALATAIVYQSLSIFLLILLNNLAYGMVLLLNRSGHTKSSRVLLCVYLPLSIMFITLYAKIANPVVEEVSFYNSRIALLVSATLPIIVFQLRERLYLYTTLAVSTGCLLFFDHIHEFAGVGYYQLGYSAPGYSFFNMLIVILYAMLISGFLYQKKILEEAEQKLQQSHQQLNHFYSELDLQHTEILAQTSKLVESREQLQEANQLIEQQKALLQAENLQLHQHLLEKNQILEASNRELHKRLDELQQFSYTISHNLRGPVANLLGLASLFTLEGANPKNHKIVSHIRTAAAALDCVITDLSQVLQLREAKETAETIQLDYLLENVLLSIRQEEVCGKIEIETALEVKTLEGVKAYLHSILYNLVSNACKYRHPKRNCRIEIRSRSANEGTLLEVKDNGMGIDLEKHGKNLFKMYKRFNESYEGRGLGLYLIKTQAEALGGFVEVQSKPGEGTRFMVWLPSFSSVAADQSKKQFGLEPQV